MHQIKLIKQMDNWLLIIVGVVWEKCRCCVRLIQFYASSFFFPEKTILLNRNECSHFGTFRKVLLSPGGHLITFQMVAKL